MHPRLLLAAALPVILAACSSSSEPKPAASSTEPGMLGRMWESTQKLNPLAPKLKSKPMKESRPQNLKALAVTMSVDPVAPKLSEVRQMTVTLKLQNHGKEMVHFQFPTTLRIDVVVKNAAGKTIEHWSEDQRIEFRGGHVSLNPGERLEYSASVATREMTAGETYTVEAWMPAYDSLSASTTVTPVK